MTEKPKRKKRESQLANELKKKIGDRLRYLRGQVVLRKGEDFSQKDLADEINQMGVTVAPGQISHLEGERRLPSVELFVALADYYATSLDYLAKRTENASSIAAIEEDLQTGGISGRLGDVYKKLPLERQEEVYKFAEALNLIVQNDIPQISPLPLNRKQRRKSAVRALLDLIQRERGTDVMEEIERTLRSKGIEIDHDP